MILLKTRVRAAGSWYKSRMVAGLLFVNTLSRTAGNLKASSGVLVSRHGIRLPSCSY
ncbi:predicted protein [Brucella suis bv. 4 str. 40]|nr:hypothetical protein BCA52141_I1099 [Brucella canis HSK A52141]AIB17120.1 Hypothetical protein BSSP3_I0388 [Brucella suis bv. 2]EEW91617.1 predicted protein [Brucella suis bv. 4 str. 40]AIB21430.1 Hypothetical protein BSPT1_I1343 [Brucella suis bv. 2]AIB24784.1 Hypothetical protein BSPT2_I1327 [Brucella suis bv. 2]